MLLAALRTLVCAALLLIAFDAQSQPRVLRCTFLGSSPIGMEGFQDNEPFGVLLKIRDERWSWEAAHGGAAIICPDCADRQLAKGMLRQGLAPYLHPKEDREMRVNTGQLSASPREFALHPRIIAVGLWVITDLLATAVRPVTDITPMTLWGVSGLARALEIDLAGATAHAVAIALQDRCFSLFGVFFRKDNSAVALDDLKQLEAAVTLDRYRPNFTPNQLAPLVQPAPFVEFPLGDERKSWGEELEREKEGR